MGALSDKTEEGVLSPSPLTSKTSLFVPVHQLLLVEFQKSS